MMPDHELNHEYLIQYLVESIRCSECGGIYNEDDIIILSREEHAWTLVVTCPVCGTESVVMAYFDEVQSDELSPPDVQEVNAWRRFLEMFEGDLRELMTY